eukprot:3508631-Pyramimonas_sp.AAC.1
MASHSGAQHSIALQVVAWHWMAWRVSGPSTRGQGWSEMRAPCPPQPYLPDVGAFECQVPSGGAGTRPALQREYDFE